MLPQQNRLHTNAFLPMILQAACFQFFLYGMSTAGSIHSNQEDIKKSTANWGLIKMFLNSRLYRPFPLVSFFGDGGWGCFDLSLTMKALGLQDEYLRSGRCFGRDFF